MESNTDIWLWSHDVQRLEEKNRFFWPWKSLALGLKQTSTTCLAWVSKMNSNNRVSTDSRRRCALTRYTCIQMELQNLPTVRTSFWTLIMQNNILTQYAHMMTMISANDIRKLKKKKPWLYYNASVYRI